MEAGVVAAWPRVDDQDREFVLASLNDSSHPFTHSFGPNCVALQQEFAEWNGSRFALATNSGTAAIHMAISACGCRPGDEVIVPAYSWSSSATAVLHHNAIPVFVDIDFETMNLDVDQIEAAISERTRAILVVHLHGLTVDMARVIELARRYDLKVIEDACQAHGAEFDGYRAGTLGDCAAFSLNQNKTLSAGEGGIFTTDDEEIHQRAGRLWSFGETVQPGGEATRNFEAATMGWMYRMPDLTAAFARSQLRKLDASLEQQRQNAKLLQLFLRDTPGLILPTEGRKHKHAWYNFVIRLDAQAFGLEHEASAFRDAFAQALSAEGVPGLLVWQSFTLPEMSLFRERVGYGRGCPWSCNRSDVRYESSNFPVAKRHCDTHIAIGWPLRAPNGRRIVAQLADAVVKVASQAHRLLP